MNSERKPSKTIYDRTGSRFWEVQTNGCHEPVIENGKKRNYPHCCNGHRREFLQVQDVESGSEEEAPAMATKLKKDAAAPPPQAVNGFLQLKLNLLQDPQTQPTFPKFDSSLNPVYSESDDDAVSTTGLASTSRGGTSPRACPATGKRNKQTSTAARSTERAPSSQPEPDSLWSSKSIGEERDLAIKFWLTLPIDRMRAIVKIDKDQDFFFTGSSSKKPKGPPKANISHSRAGVCVCPDCVSAR